MPNALMHARFDSLSPTGRFRGIQFGDLRRVVTACTPADVADRLAEVEDAVSDGFHAAGFLSYEAAPGVDSALVAHEAPAGIPLLQFGIFGERVDGEPLTDLAVETGAYRIGPLEGSVTRAEYESRVRAILGLIAAGDTYQVNYTFRLRGEFEGSPAALYRDLCRAQRSDFCAHLSFGRFALISASPELFFELSDGRLVMRPMKGTRARGRWAEEDERVARELAASPKDRAENLMIVDLLRNDIGRVAEFGSVQVSRLFEVERYPTVHQLTSTVEGRPRPGVGVADVFAALFPSGSVTGAPKVRTCEIIREMESTPRGVYTGAIGFISGGESVFSVAIRTAVVDLEAGALELGVGSGITADSQPGAEFEECMSKGAFLRFTPPDFQLLESLRLECPGGYRRLADHLGRLEASARYFSFPYDSVLTETKLASLEESLPTGVYKVRVLLSRTGELSIGHEPIPATSPVARVRLATRPIDRDDPFLFHKTTNRAPYEAALAEARECDDVIFFNRDGELTESSRANLVLEIDGELVTPPLESGLLGGVCRAESLRLGRIRERILTATDLQRATRIHLINSVRGWREAILA